MRKWESGLEVEEETLFGGRGPFICDTQFIQAILRDNYTPALRVEERGGRVLYVLARDIDSGVCEWAEEWSIEQMCILDPVDRLETYRMSSRIKQAEAEMHKILAQYMRPLLRSVAGGRR